MELEFLFDYISPYTYFASTRVSKVTQEIGAKLVYRPVLFAGLLNHWGGLGPAEISPKRTYMFKQCLRYARRNKIPFRGPKKHPFKTLFPLRLSLPEVAGENQEKVIRQIWQLGWVDGADLGSEEVIVDSLKSIGLNGEEMAEKTRSPEAKDSLRKNTDEAIQRGAFGVPTFFINGELFWGNDSLEDLIDFAKGKDSIDGDLIKEILGRERGSDRKVIRKP